MQNVLFLDIETVSLQPKFNELSKEWQNLWAEKTKWQRGEEIEADEFYEERAGILAEFGKVVCVSLGYFRGTGAGREFRVKSLYNHDEATILSELSLLLNEHFSQYFLCAHNGKEFDFPYLGRRMVVNKIPLPGHLDLAGKKPWEVQHIDTMELWKFGDRKSFTSLKLLAALFDIPTPKDDIDGSMVGSVYWNDNDLDRIARYCEKDVITLARVWQRLRGEEPLGDNEVVLGN
ncbi:MAG: ribonuclease H-like domain-containing protein [Flavobacteriia bacterium]|nr:ribonuclease H-like domain-containing protein [Flavobacteriia bacterium]